MTYFRPGFWEFRSIPHQKVTMLRAPRAAKNTHWSFPMNRSRWNIRQIQNPPTSNSMLTQHFEMYHIYPKCALLTIETYWYTNLLLVLQLHHSQRVLCKTETYLYSAIFRKCRYCLVLSFLCLSTFSTAATCAAGNCNQFTHRLNEAGKEQKIGWTRNWKALNLKLTRRRTLYL